MIVIELIGGPGSGKTTTAAQLWGYLKDNGIFCEYLREPAQEEIYKRGNLNRITQLHLTTKLMQKLHERQLEGVKICIVDTPILGPFLYSSLNDRMFEVFSSINDEIREIFDVRTVFITRTEHSHWRSQGRTEATLEQAKLIDSKTLDTYQDHCVEVIQVLKGIETKPEILAVKLELI